MKDLEPNSSDVRATLQINFAISLMFSMPLALIGLHLVRLNANYLEISLCYVVSMAIAAAGAAIMSCVEIRKPLALIMTALLLGLLSAFAMIDVKAIEDHATKSEDIEKARFKFMAGLSIGSLGFTIGSIGL